MEFRGLTREIENAVAQGPFKLEKRPYDSDGLVQGRIKDGKVCSTTDVHCPIVDSFLPAIHNICCA